jgi:hypothetical protein
MTSLATVTVTFPPQLSLAIMLAVSGSGTSVAQETVMFPGHVRVGGVLSNTVMIWAQVAVLPQTSVAVYTRVIVYWFAHTWLDITSFATVTVTVPPQLSVAVTRAVFGAGTSAAQETVIPGGHVSVGGVPSYTVIIWAQVAVLPHRSVAM